MVLAAIAHHADDQIGIARITYHELEVITSLSRAKIAGGLDTLENLKIIHRKAHGKSTYALCNYDPSGGWGKLPAKGLYSAGRISAFGEFHLRRRTELDALKFYFLFVARRDRHTNLVHLSYDKIEEYSGIDRNRIKSGVSLLAANGLVYVEHLPSNLSEFGVSNAYRLPHIDPYNHMGTRGRGMDLNEVFS